MVHVAREMKRREMKQPLLIGGATTSRMHTSVRIAPEYEQGVVHVLDASRSVTVASALLNKGQKIDFLNTIRAEYKKLREDFGNKKSTKQYLPFSQAQQNKVKIDWSDYTPPIPSFTGVKAFDGYDLAEIAPFIDWEPFFIAWEMHGKFPQLLKDEKIGKEASKLFEDAQALLKRIINEKWLIAKGAIGFWPAHSDGKDTVEVTIPSGPAQTGKEEGLKLEFLRQQIKKTANQPNISLADFIKPGEGGGDYIGAFAVSIHGIESHIKRFEEQYDDYNKIILQALADRLAEAFTELLHMRVRKEFWQYATDEGLTYDQLIEEKYSGIRPAPGYPACPDHTEKYKLFFLLGGEKNTGIKLTESLAMYPASSVSGWYFAHPDSRYFGVGKIEKDQVKDYAERKGMELGEIEKWLRPILEYDS